MARTSIKLYASGFAQVDSDNPNTIVPAVTDGPNKLGSWGTDRNSGVRLLFQIQDARSTLGTKRLYEAQAKFATAQPNGGLIYPLKASYNPSTVTWNTQPQMYAQADGVEYLSGGSHNNTKTDATFVQTLVTTEALSLTAKAFLQNNAGIILASSGAYALWVYTTLVDTTAPYIEIFYDDSTDVTSQIVYRSGPASGYANPRNAITFGWDYDKSGDYSCAADFTQASATFYWKESTAGSYTSVAVSGATESVTIAANTFPTGKTIQWYVSGTDTNGTTTTSEVFSFSTAAGTANATAQSPISSVEDGGGPITFTWTLSSTDGQTPSGVDLWWKLPSEDNQHWHALLSNASPRTSYTAAAGTFSAGEIQWIVRAYNVDGTAGPWSTPGTGYYSFICVAAPDPVEGLNATAVPITTISWQSAGQQAYEITIDGEVVHRAFGTDVYSWTVEEPLEEGQHTISVRVQGQYGFWSQPSTAIVMVSGPDSQMQLTGEFGTDAILTNEYEPDPYQEPVPQPVAITWQQGGLKAADGTAATNNARCRTPYYQVGEEYTKISVPSAYAFNIFLYSEESAPSGYIGRYSDDWIQGSAGDVIITSDDCNYYKLCICYSNTTGAIAPSDISGVTVNDYVLPDSPALIRYYRDGIYIGTARSNSTFIDRRLLGTHSYFSRMFLPGGGYKQSNTVTGSMHVTAKMIAPLDGSAQWLTLRLTENSADEDVFQWSRTQVVQHFTGAAYPQTELSQFEDLNASYTCAFRDRSEALAFEALRGKPVILKSRGDNVVIGILNQISKRQTVFYTAYAFTITQICDRDFTEAE